MKPPKLSDAQVTMLRSIRDHGNGFHHVRGNSQYGGAPQTMTWLRRRGLAVFSTEHSGIDRLTDAGLKALEAFEQPKPHRTHARK